MRSLTLGLIGMLAGLLAAPAARAEYGVLSEVRLGVFAHDAQVGSGPREGGADINGEVLFVSPVPTDRVDFAPTYLRWLLQPRPMAGFQANTSGYTSQGYAGVTFTTTLFTDVLHVGDAILLDAGEAGSVNDGHVDEARGDTKRIGSNVLFRTSGDIGYRITPRLTSYIEIDHESNAGLDRANQGITNAGIRFGFTF